MLNAMVSHSQAGVEHTNVVKQIGAQIVDEMAKQSKVIEDGFEKLCCAILAKKTESIEMDLHEANSYDPEMYPKEELNDEALNNDNALDNGNALDNDNALNNDYALDQVDAMEEENLEYSNSTMWERSMVGDLLTGESMYEEVVSQEEYSQQSFDQEFLQEDKPYLVSYYTFICRI